jgi:hypothetical protein
LNECPQYGQRAPLSNEIRAQCGQTRWTGWSTYLRR